VQVEVPRECNVRIGKVNVPAVSTVGGTAANAVGELPQRLNGVLAVTKVVSNAGRNGSGGVGIRTGA